MMRITEIGEFGLIDRVKEALGPPGAGVVVGIGDDVAVLRARGDKFLLATCDIQVEGIHFLKEAISPYQLGRKAAAINISDIAAMGGVPTYLLVSLALPKETTVGYVDGLYEGLKIEAEAAGVQIVGGNMSHSSGMMIDIFLLGEVEAEHLLLRSGARPGDKVLVTGSVGGSGAGLALLLDPTAERTGEEAKRVLKAHLTPTPRLKEGRAIARSRLATSMIDVSDGTVSDVGHICEASGVGVRLWAHALPVSPATRAVAEALGKDPLEWALHSGEDYELLFTAPADKAEQLAVLVEDETTTPVTIIGEIIEEGMNLVLPDGESLPLEPKGWDHFRRR
ncbi:MAG: thiamine-phosphate kinase [Anaerolineae bacterium]